MVQSSVDKDVGTSTSGIDVASASQWLSTSEQQDLDTWSKQMAILLPAFTVAWGFLHALCAVLSRILADPESTVAKKDRVLWDNKCATASLPSHKRLTTCATSASSLCQTLHSLTQRGIHTYASSML